MDAKTAKLYIYIVCILICLIIGYTGPALFLGEFFPIPAEEESFLKYLFKLYLWGDKIMGEREITSSTLLMLNSFTCVIWGIITGWIITLIAVKKNTVYTRNTSESTIKSYS